MTRAPTDDPVGGIAGGPGASIHHDSARLHVTGRARFIDDLPEPPDLLHAALVTSPHAHARILGIDGSAALALPGVAAVISAADIPGVNDVAPILSGEPCLAAGTADYAGHVVAAVAADSLALARQAVKRVKVDYEKLTPVLSIEDALAAESYTCAPQILVRGDPDGALAAAPHRLRGRLETGGQDHFYLEGQVAMALPRDDGSMLVLSSTQHPTEVQHGVAHLLGLPFAAVDGRGAAHGRCLRRQGEPGDPYRWRGGAARGAHRPAGQAAGAARRRHDRHRQAPRLPDRLAGRVRRRRPHPRARRPAGDPVRNVADLTPAVLTRAVCHVDNYCFLPDVRISGYPCKTNTVSNTAFRGFGGPQGMIGTEVMIEQIARHTGLSIEAVRAANLYGAAPRDVTPYGQPVEDNILEPLLTKLAADADLAARRADIDVFNRSSPVIRKGLAVFPLKFGISFNMPTLNQGGALVHVYTDGSVHLNHGGTEMGQGLFTKVAQVVADVFQIELDRIQISATSTDKVPNTSATAASAGSDLNGMAAHEAASQIRQRMAEVAAPALGVAADAVRFSRGRVEGGGKSLGFAEVARLAWLARVSLSATGFYRTPKIHWDQASMTGSPFFYFAYGAAASEVAIDCLTGEYRVLRTDIIHDCGRSLNPRIDRGQVEGAFVQGMGWLTTEELWWDAEGRLRTHAPSTYKIPGSRDVPADLRVHLLRDEPNRAPTIFRSKAVGEPPLMLGIAVWLALRDAVASLADHRLTVSLDAPATPERVLAAVDEIKTRAAGQPVKRELAPAK